MRKISTHFLKHVLFMTCRNLSIAALMLMLFSGKIFAGEITFSQRIYASGAIPVQVGNPNSTSTVDMVPKTGPFADATVSDLIVFGVDQFDRTYFPNNFTAQVKLKIEKWNVNNILVGTQYENLTINYSPYGNTVPYIDKSTYNFKNAYKVKVTVQAIFKDGIQVTDLPLNLYVETEIKANRIYDFESKANVPFSFNKPLLINTDCDANSSIDEIELSWNSGFTSMGVLITPEEYQLEWVFINDYGLSNSSYLAQTNLNYDFKHNSTRITTTNNSYRITCAFDHGYLLYRVRGIGRRTTDPLTNIVGVWSTANETGAVSTLISSGSGLAFVQEYEADKNWQYAATYAEEGKKKEVVNYFDGSLRNRESVTKVNSDKNVIVGQTIYDSQGRAAINVLPVPVPEPICNVKLMEPAIKYYPNFNQDDNGNQYSNDDFDLDASDPCSSSTGEMLNTFTGASNYYSPSNLNKTGYQAFVPDANNFPFTQIEYTPDNTGRISKQSGVGPLFQLGTGHESAYLYGQPNQIQLDRLFGSEVGDAAHYKKNVIIDANGQISTTYMDQEGRTIATSLAGAPPKTCAGCTEDRLSALASESAAQKQLTVDLFAKNALGQSTLNAENISNTGIEFNSQLLVTNRSLYQFDYDIKVTKFTDSCLADKICFDCVYDLTLKITNDCGEIQGNEIVKTIGKLSVVDEGLAFNIHCDGPKLFPVYESIDVTLEPGSYTVSKILTVNQDAKNFYVEQFLDTNINKCLKPLHEFITESLAHVDTSDCDITCEICAKSLKTIAGVYYADNGDARDAFVAAGLGNEFDFDYLMEECGKPCKEQSWCEATYEQLLVDVSPDGQYAQIRNDLGVVSLGSFLLSVLNTSNQLPVKSISPAPNWRNPRAIVNGNSYPYYLEDDGSRSIVKIIANGSNYLPIVISTAATDVFTDVVGGFKYTYPENLAYEEDFVAQWKTSWAKSLVQYHPEYCYYESCIDYGKQQGTYTLTSDEFDSKLLNAETFAAAVTAGLINSNYLSSSASNISKIADFFNPTGTLHDPFAVPGSAYQTGTAFNIYAELFTKFNAYRSFTDNSGIYVYSMLDMAAIAARCGTQYGVLPGGTCMKFGNNFYPNTYPNSVFLNDSIRDSEWSIFKNFYLAEKLKLQQRRADGYALHSCNGFNGCIGDSAYNPFASGMFTYGSWGTFFSSEFFDSHQPCSVFTHHLYLSKRKRFYKPSNLPGQSADEMDYQYYLQTGQCPIAADLQYLLGALAFGHQLTDNAVNLMAYPQFTQDLYNEVSISPPTTFIPYQWNTTVNSGNQAEFEFFNTLNSSQAATLKLDLASSGLNAFTDIVGFSQLVYTGTNGGMYTFDITAHLNTTAGGGYKVIKGETSIKLIGCTFKFQCTPNQLAIDMSNLWSAMLAQNLLTASSTTIALQAQPFVTSNIKNRLGTSTAALQWNYNSGSDRFELWDNANPSKILVIKFNTYTPSSFTSSTLSPAVSAFSGIKSNDQNFFIVKGIDALGAEVVDIEGEVYLEENGLKTGVEMGKCGLPDPITCEGDEYKLKDHLAALLKDVLVKKPFVHNIDLTASPKYTTLLDSYFPPPLAPNVKFGSSKYDNFLVNFGQQIKEQLNFNVNCECSVIINHKTDKGDPLLFEDITNLTNFTLTGSADASGNYHHFFVIAQYSSPSGLRTDTLFGEVPCLPLKECSPCTNEVKPSCTACADSITFEVNYGKEIKVCANETFTVDYILWKNGEKTDCIKDNVHPLINYGDGTVSNQMDHAYAYPGVYSIQLSFSNEKEPDACVPQKISIQLTILDCKNGEAARYSQPVPSYHTVQQSIDIANGKTYVDSTFFHYLSYKSALERLAVKNAWAKTDTAFVKAVPYSEFAALGYSHGINHLLDFIENFDPEIDNKNQLKNIRLFIVEEGNFKTNKTQYERYERAIQNFNQTVTKNGNGKAVELIADSTFYKALFADHINDYLKYLKNQQRLGKEPLNLSAFMASSEAFVIQDDKCKQEYEKYVDAYMNFEKAQSENPTCGEYKLTTPFYSYDEFVKNNLCCNAVALVQFDAYISSFSSLTICPCTMPAITVCGSTNVDVEKCQSMYLNYLEAIKKFNESGFAMTYGFFLDTNLYPTFNSFLQAELCDCVQKYIEYLSTFQNTEQYGRPKPPLDIDHFAPCSITLPVGADSCKIAYEKYIKGITNYNEFVSSNPQLNLPPITVVYDYKQYIILGLCHCVDKYLAFLQSIINGTANLDLKNREELYAQFDLNAVCEIASKLPCDPHMPNDTTSSPAYVKYDNPCAQYQISLAIENAQNAYQQYIDSIRTDIATAYLRHCLGAFENFTVTYDDKEYHFTLYYYDQAGNLIRTIPPEGVHLVNIAAPTDLIAQQINSDRTFNHHTYTTSHTLPTTYEYNSLNQLVKQSVPDHDKMNIWEINLPNGLDSRFEVSAIQMVNSMTGFMSGKVKIATAERGYLYQTADGGNTWQRMNDLVASDLKKVQMIDATAYGFAIGTKGIVLKTEDSGNSWDMLDTYTSSNIREQLNDLCFKDQTHGVVVGNNGVIYTTSNGTAFTISTALTLPAGFVGNTISSITYTTSISAYYITVVGAMNGFASSLIYKSSNDGVTWTQESAIQTVHLNDVNCYSTNSGASLKAYAVGDDGSLIYSANNGATWQTIATGTAKKFNQIYFYDDNNGVALIEISAGYSQIFKTQNGGSTWVLMGNSIDYYSALSSNIVANPANPLTGAKLIAVGKNGVVHKIILQSGTPFGIIPTVSAAPLTSDLTAVWSKDIGGGIVWTLTTGVDGKLYYSFNTTASSAIWSNITVTGLAADNAKNITIDIFSGGANPAFSGTIVTQNGKLYSVYKAANTNLPVVTQISTGASVMADLCLDVANHKIYTFDNSTNKKVYTLQLVATAATTTTTSVGVATTISQANSIDFQNNQVVLCGANGEIFTGQISGATITWAENSKKVTPLPLNDIQYSGGAGGTIYAVGNDGSVLQRQGSGNWRTMLSNTAEKLNAIKLATVLSGLIAGNNGTLIRMNVSGIDMATGSTIATTNTTQNLYDIALQNDVAYIVGAGGTLLYSATISTTNPALSNQNTSKSLLGVCFKPFTTQVISVGDAALINLCAGTTRSINRNVFTPRFLDVHFSDVNNGIVAGMNYTLRKTSDGGATWNIILPSYSAAPTSNFSRVWTINGNYALVVGPNSYLATIENSVATSQSTSPFSAANLLASIKFNKAKPLEGYMGANNRKVYGIKLTPAGSSYSIAINNSIPQASFPTNSAAVVYALHVFANGSFMGVGSNGFIQYNTGITPYTWSAYNNSVTTYTMRDVFFHDDLNGYVVGDNGVMLKSTSGILNTNGYLASLTWGTKSIVDKFNVTNSTLASQVNINAIEFTSRYEGIWGGKYVFTSTANYPYVRLIKDESEIFSTYFWYDKVGRMTVSQNTKQFNKNAFSYTKYDELGRIIEVGEKAENKSPLFPSIFGSLVNNHYNNKVIDDLKFTNWINEPTGIRTEVTRTYYDVPIITGLPVQQANLRKRVATITYEDKNDGNDQTYNHATHYSYDIHGNVKTLLQDNPNVGTH